MTQDALQRGQELVRVIKEAKEFQDGLKRAAKGQSGKASLTLTASTGLSSPSLALYRYPDVVAALTRAVNIEVSKLEQEFKAL